VIATAATSQSVCACPDARQTVEAMLHVTCSAAAAVSNKMLTRGPVSDGQNGQK